MGVIIRDSKPVSPSKLTLRQKIEELLIQFPMFRDNDEHLVSFIWKQQLVNAGFDPYVNYHISEILSMMSDKTLSKYDSITRIRRLIQEEIPELRGASYKGSK